MTLINNWSKLKAAKPCYIIDSPFAASVNDSYKENILKISHSRFVLATVYSEEFRLRGFIHFKVRRKLNKHTIVNINTRKVQYALWL